MAGEARLTHLAKSQTTAAHLIDTLHFVAVQQSKLAVVCVQAVRRVERGMAKERGFEMPDLLNATAGEGEHAGEGAFGFAGKLQLADEVPAEGGYGVGVTLKGDDSTAEQAMLTGVLRRAGLARDSEGTAGFGAIDASDGTLALGAGLELSHCDFSLDQEKQAGGAKGGR